MCKMANRNSGTSVSWIRVESDSVQCQMCPTRISLKWLRVHAISQWGRRDRQMLLQNGIPERCLKWTES